MEVDLYKINQEMTTELLEKERTDPEFKQAIKERHVNVIVDFAEWILGDVFEVGCRHGILLELIENCKSEIFTRVGNTYGIDMSHEAIEVLRSKGLDGDVQTAETLIESIALYRMFDTIFCIHTLEHCIDIPKVIAGIWECLRPGGHALIEIPLQPKEPTPTVWGHYHCFETEQELIDMMDGFKHIITFREDNRTHRRYVFQKEI
jgi:2-polyprenyl-3-methyl-5-hydroxy-6-metoxy-1,4-benzoquinol methylase